MAGRENTARAVELFGDYDILETLGQGGMGIVYRAHDSALDRNIALKVLRDDLRAHTHVVARFQREAEACASLDHPNIVHIYSVGSVGKIPYIAMECIEGKPLNRVMKEQGTMGWKRALGIGRQIAEALASAHDSGIIHRDIKPGNIMLGPEDHAYVTDFGIAKVLTAETQLTLDGSRLGTPHYMSPERCQNKEVTASSDIYSLGVLLFQLMTAQLPYEAPTPVSLIRSIITDPPRRLRDHLPDAPENVERLLAHMMEKDSKNRPGDAHLLAEMIERVLSGKAIVDNASGHASALEEFRDAMSTPTSSSSSHLDSITTSIGVSKPLFERLAGLWNRIPGTLLTILAVFLLLFVASLVGSRIAAHLNAGYAVDVVRQMDRGTSAWQQSGLVADFVDESPGVIAATVNLPSFEVEFGGWTSSGLAVIQMKGLERSSRQGQSVIYTLDPIRKTAAICIPPVGAFPVDARAQNQPALTLLDFPRGSQKNLAGLFNGDFLFQARTGNEPGNPAPGILLWRGDRGGGAARTVFASDHQPRISFTGLGSPFTGPLAIAPGGTRMAVAISDALDGESWVLTERSEGAGNRSARFSNLTVPGHALSTLEYAPDGSWIAYTREIAGDHRELWIVESGGTELNGKKLVQGDFTTVPGAISPDSDALLIATATPGGGRTLQRINVRTGDIEAELGEGQSAVWHPGGPRTSSAAARGEFIVAAAPDRKGHTQLWAIQTAAPHGRTQLTYLETGTTNTLCAISQDGAWALTCAATTTLPTPILIDLSRAQF